jgi:hypothetical protein
MRKSQEKAASGGSATRKGMRKGGLERGGWRGVAGEGWGVGVFLFFTHSNDKKNYDRHENLLILVKF